MFYSLVIIASTITLPLAYYIKIKKTSPILILPAFYFFTALYSLICAYWFNFGRSTPFGFFSLVPEAAIEQAILAYLYASFLFCTGAALAALSTRTQKTAKIIDYRENIRDRISKAPDLTLLSISLIPGVLFTISFGLDQLISRSTYFSSDAYNLGATAARLTLPICIFLCAFIKNRTLRYTSFLLNYLPFFSASSRVMLLVIFFYAVGIIFSERNKNAGKILIITTLLLLSSGVSFEYRGNASQGLIPHTSKIFSDGIPFNGILLSINYLTSYSVSLLAYMLTFISEHQIPLAAQLNPFPSALSGYNAETMSVRVSDYVPLAAIGEILINGKIVFFGFYSTVGFLSTWLYRRASHPYQRIIILLSISIFAFFSTQYPVRDSTRILYYSLVLYITTPIILRFSPSLQQKNFRPQANQHKNP